MVGQDQRRPLLLRWHGGEIPAECRVSGNGLAEALAQPAVLSALPRQGKDDYPRKEVVSSWRVLLLVRVPTNSV